MCQALSLFGSILLILHFVCASTAATGFNVTTEDSTPWLVYNPPGAWSDSVVDDPTQPQNYSCNSWHATSTPGATATFTFNGTGIWFYGATRPGYGSYSVAIDGKTVVDASAYSPQDEFRVLLGGAGGLSPDLHVAELVSGDEGPIDLDMLVFETWAAPGTDSSAARTDINAQDPDLQLNPPFSWQMNASTGTQYTDASGARMQYDFEGDAIAIYGSMASTYGSYSVAIDGSETQYQASSGLQKNFAHEHSLMHFANDLGPGNHTLAIVANPGQPGVNGAGIVAISNISVYHAVRDAAPSIPSNTVGAFSAFVSPVQTLSLSTLLTAPTSSGSVGNVSASTSTNSNMGIIIGAIAGGAGLFIILAIILLAFCLKRRRARRGIAKLEPPPSPRSFVQRPASDASGAWGRPAIPSSVLHRALEDPFADPEKGMSNPFADSATHSISIHGGPSASPTPLLRAVSPLERPYFRRSPSPSLGIVSRYTPSPVPSHSSESSDGSQNPFLVP